VKLVVREGFVLVGVGLTLGMLAAVSLRSVIRSEIYGVGPLDPLVVGGVTVVFAVVAVCACIVPARRALRVDPVRVLNQH
jgi:putative ABC transport system permease protein